MAPPKTPPTKLADSDWTKRHEHISFRKLMLLEKHTTKHDTFFSTSAGFPPTHTSRTYGGHVFAQAAWAAAHTVPYGLHVHSMTGYFLLLGDTRFAFEYRVRRIRDGGVYALRLVEVYQDSDAAGHGRSPTFIGMVGFKRDERNKHKDGAKGQRQDFKHQEMPRDWFEAEFSDVLKKKQRFEDWPLAQGLDGMWNPQMTIEEWKQRGDAFPGLEMRKVDMRGYNSDKVPQGGFEDHGESARKWRLILLYRLVADKHDETSAELGTTDKQSGADDVINLHGCAHLYASDRNSLLLAYRALGFDRFRGQSGSLSHTVNFHGNAADMIMVDSSTGKLKEYAQESWISNSGADRVTHGSRIWDRKTGAIIASTVQDGMMRIDVKPNPDVIDGDAILRRDAKL